MLRNGNIGAGLDLAYGLDSLGAKIDEGGQEQYGKDSPWYPLLGKLPANYSEQQDQGWLPGAKVGMKLNLHVERKNEEGNQGGNEQVELECSAPQNGDEERYCQRKACQRPVELPLPPQVRPPGGKLVDLPVKGFSVSFDVMFALELEHVPDGRRSLTPGGRVGDKHRC